MLRSTLVLLFTLLIAGAAHADRGGVEVGNGGNAVQCNGKDTFASLDYIAARDGMGEDYDLSESLWTDESLQRIGALIAAKLPTLSRSYQEFVHQLVSNDKDQHYLWIPDQNLEEVDQDAPRFAIFHYCMADFGSVLLTQVVVRTVQSSPQGKQIVFRYNQGVLHDLSPKHRSFLLVHEWLWNFTDDIATNRNIDWLLHSVWFEKASSAEVIQKFKEFGFKVP
jgi:hypothetical protein